MLVKESKCIHFKSSKTKIFNNILSSIYHPSYFWQLCYSNMNKKLWRNSVFKLQCYIHYSFKTLTHLLSMGFVIRLIPMATSPVATNRNEEKYRQWKSFTMDGRGSGRFSTQLGRVYEYSTIKRTSPINIPITSPKKAP